MAKSKRGGHRPGAGRPRGSLEPQTLDKLAQREILRQRFFAEMVPMLDAQIANAKGISYLVARNVKSGKFERVTQAMLDIWLKGESVEDLERIEVWEKDPNVQAWADIANRALDKPTESVDMNLSGQVDVVDILRKRHARHSKR